MSSLVFFTAFIVATANAGLIGAPLAAPWGAPVAPWGAPWAAPVATSVVGTKTISLAAPIGVASPLIGKSVIAAPAVANPWGWGAGAPWLGKSIVAAPAVSTVALGGPVLKAW